MGESAATGRVAFAYDQLYPETVGGAQRYYWALTAELARGRPVTYLTVKRWPGPDTIERDGVELVGVCPEDGLDFRFGLARHLARSGARYEAVHCACFPPGAAVAARAGLVRHRRVPLIVDWHEVLPRSSWRRIRGAKGDPPWLLQKLAVRASAVAITFSALHERRLREEGRRGPIFRSPEFLPDGEAPELPPGERERVIVFVGRLVDDKRPWLLPPALAELRRADPAWRAIVFGDGPERGRVEQAIGEAGVREAIELPGFASWETISEAQGRAAAFVFPSEREGFGLAVLEAAAHGLPSVLVAEPDNAATELIEDGVNGAVCPTGDPAELARAVLRVADAGAPERTRAWFDQVSERFSVPAAAAVHEALYARLRGAR